MGDTSLGQIFVYGIHPDESWRDYNPFRPRPKPWLPKFECGLVAKLKGKKCLREVDVERHLQRVNVLSFSADQFLDYLSDTCTSSNRAAVDERHRGMVQQVLANPKSRACTMGGDLQINWDPTIPPPPPPPPRAILRVC